MSDSLPTSARPSSDVATIGPKPIDGAPTLPPSKDNTRTIAPTTDGIAASPAAKIPGYEILGELGRGGMGVVYKARQIALNRIVALKMILAGNYASQADLVRFLTEAEAVAALQHPNIVQIFETGQHEGLPYFTLEFLEGGTLSDKVREQPLPAREAAQLIEQVARGVQFAHDKGLVHRDLKPDNVLLTNDGTPKVTDFGLVKRLGSGSDLTQSGAVVGTPSYMAPEQAEGKRKDVGPAADVYALGAILYRLIAGRPPFQAATALDTLVQVVSEEPVSPSQLQPNTPKDLETICLKCLRKEPQKRYESVSALADDLNHFLRGEPIVARPVGMIERGWKWVKRNPVVTALVSAVIVTLCVGTVVSYLKYREATTQRQSAEKARDRTREALDAMTSSVMEDSIRTQKELSAGQKQFLTEVLTYYREFAGDKADDERSRARTASAAYRVGRIEYRLGRVAEAANASRLACEDFDKLSADFPAASKYRKDLAESHAVLAICLDDLGQGIEAEKEFRKALGLYEQLASEFPADPEYKWDVASNCNNTGRLLSRLNRGSEAEQSYRRALTIYEQLVSGFPAEPKYHEQLASTQSNLGVLLASQGKYANALEQYENALAIREKLVVGFPAVAEHRRDLARTHQNFGAALADMGKQAEAAEHHRKAIALTEKLVAEFPTVGEYRADLAWNLNNLANVIPDAEAEILHRKALEIREKLVADFPGVPSYRLQLAITLNNLAQVLKDLQKRAGAEAIFRRALKVLTELTAEYPTDAEYREQLGETSSNSALLFSDLGKESEAERALRDSIRTFEKLVADYPAVLMYHVRLGGTCINLGNSLDDAKPVEALPWFDKAVAELNGVMQQSPNDAAVREYLQLGCWHRALTLDRLKRFDEASGDWDKAVALTPPDKIASIRLSRAASRAKSGQLEAAIKGAEESLANATADGFYDAACVFAIVYGQSKNEKHALRAMELLRQAAAKGYKDVEHIKSDTDLDSLRSRADFKQFVADLEKKHPPPAPGKPE